MIDRRLCFSLVVSLALSTQTGLLLAEVGFDPIRILWAGSSSVYYHNQPKVCAHWLTACCEMPAESYLVGKSGTGIHVYLRPGFVPQYGLKPRQTILEAISAESYDFVVLQIPA